MQLRISYSKKANAFSRSPASLTTLESRMCTLVRGIRICHGPRNLHEITKNDVSNAWPLRVWGKHRCVSRRTNSRCITTSKTYAKQGLASREVSYDLLQYADTVPTTSTNDRFSVTPGVVKQGGRSQEVQTENTAKPIRMRYFSSDRRLSRANRRPSIRHQRISDRPSRNDLSPLSAWLDSRTRAERASIWAFQSQKHTRYSKNPSLSTILLFHLETKESVAGQQKSLANSLIASALPILYRSGFSLEDLHLWGDILAAPTGEEVVHRYLSRRSRKPTFLLLEILRRPHLNSKSFCPLLVHSYHLIRGIITPQFKEPVTEHVPDDQLILSPPESIPQKDNHLLEYTTFEVLVCRLLFHARHTWPAAMVTISNMVVSYCQRLVKSQIDISPQIYSRLCRIHNLILSRLSLPASANPMKSMTYNWQAQRIILASAAAYQPSLQLNKAAYRAVARVLLASEKSSTEMRYASLLQRTWPPWRKELDGMDVKRSPDEDISRVVSVLSRMREAGYAHDAVDKAIKVLGGREPDGTPTIQTRRIFKVRRPHPNRSQSTEDDKHEDCTVEWAARITATRDVHEAWDAFQSFTRDGERPSHSMYSALFEKLIYKTMTDVERQGRIPLAGDVKETLPMIDDNTSASEKLRMQPPTVDSLFAQMISDDIRPSGRFLEMLIRNARSFESLALYMKHGAISYNKFIELLRKPVFVRDSVLKSVPDTIFDAFIRFLCRPRQHPITDPSQYLEQEDSIVCFKHNSDLIAHAFELVRRRQPSSRNAWYMIIRAVARSGFIFDPSLNQHANDVMSWRFVEGVVRASLKAGFQLDTYGFGRVCIGLEKAIRAKPHVSQKTAALVQTGPEMIKETFTILSESVEASLTESMEDGYAFPKMLHDFAGYQLHRYIRVLGLTNDIDEAVSVLQWMVKHKEELDIFSIQSRNGQVSLRRTLIAARAFLGWTDAHEKIIGRLRDSIEKLNGSWGGWPTDVEVESYLANEAQDDSASQNGIHEQIT